MDSRIQLGALRPTGSEHEWCDERRRPTNGVARRTASPDERRRTLLPSQTA